MSAKAKILGSAAALALAAMAYVAPASAIPVSCKDTSKNYMNVDSAYVASCIDAGVGNIGQGGDNDPFLDAHPEWSLIGQIPVLGNNLGSFTQDGPFSPTNNNSGSFTLNPDLWDDFGDIAIGFKFGTGNKPDEWFVYLLQDLVSSGDWSFINTNHRGGGLSHLALFGVEGTHNVPEPAMLTLLGLGLLSVGFARRKKA